MFFRDHYLPGIGWSVSWLQHWIVFSFGLRNCREMFHPQLLPNCQKRYIYVVHSLKGGLIGPLFAQINNKLATLFIIQGVFYRLPRVQTLLLHSCTLRGQHPYPGANQTCQSVLPHSHTLVMWLVHPWSVDHHLSTQFSLVNCIFTRFTCKVF